MLKKSFKKLKKNVKKLEKKLEKKLKECSQSKNSFWVQKISNVELKKKKKNCPRLGLNRGPSDLQHSTLPLDHEIQRESWQKI